MASVAAWVAAQAAVPVGAADSGVDAWSLVSIFSVRLI